MNLPESGEKRRLALFKNIYRKYGEWEQLIESEGPEKSILEIDGEDVCFHDLLVGIDELPPRQREAFQLHVLDGMSEGQAAEIMFPGSPWSTPVQQYAKSALVRMVAAYDRQQTEEGRLENKLKIAEKLRRSRPPVPKTRSKFEERPEGEREEDFQQLRKNLFD